MRVYVAGPVTGRPRRNLAMFEHAAKQLVQAGHVPVVPHRHVPAQAERHVAMRRCGGPLLAECDGVCLLPGWRGSRGAQTEYLLAMRLDMDVRELSRWTG